MARQSSFRKDLFEGKTVFISGGGTGIGFGIASGFIKHGANVGIMGRREQKLKEACAKLDALAGAARSTYAVGDVRKPELCAAAVAKVVERFGGLDIVVNNAAGNFMCDAENLTAKGFHTVIDIDLHGTFNVSKAAFPYLKKGGGGVILNTSATLQYKATPFQAHASAAKAGIDVLTQTFGLEWGAHNIRVVSIAPGPIAGTEGGPGGRVFGSGAGTKEADREEILTLGNVPLGRYGEVEDIANTAMFLASDAGSFINATNIVVDGGHWHGTSGWYHNFKDMVRYKSEEERTKKKGPKPKL
mmetsp:Transcript_19011/g.53323  ORF Transcript_19011/g.53323 Transcript_19011/m.53323 type:complete len:301 (+) Transcript_19011:130-1032(+)|eukprot:CAMPEP_0119120136 /NCGR_PEP_ID=MMETSP1310-20130426/1312_1 /TAXON_ID=464262 /ORGANISM="Genus nov. species nov., Strain RCC2339" /LENGTH=300 /DNA_ID=CAMNT_0007109601 /DNA_START=71 /DNA_END=973 /DNA_ORIENTATION=+